MADNSNDKSLKLDELSKATDNEIEQEEEASDVQSPKPGVDENSWKAHWDLLLSFLILTIILVLEYGFKVELSKPVALIINGIAYLLAGREVAGVGVEVAVAARLAVAAARLADRGRGREHATGADAAGVGAGRVEAADGQPGALAGRQARAEGNRGCGAGAGRACGARGAGWRGLARGVLRGAGGCAARRSADRRAAPRRGPPRAPRRRACRSPR